MVPCGSGQMMPSIALRRRDDGVIYSYPVACHNGEYTIADGLDIDDFSRERMDATDAELREERNGVRDLL